MRTRARHKRSRALVGVATAVIALLAMAACGSSQEATSSQTSRPTRDKSTNKTPDLGCRFIVASTLPRETIPGDVTQFLLSAVAEPAPCYDKVTFTFDAGGGSDEPPGYLVEYRKKPFLEGVSSSTAGFPDAKYVLYVEMRPASATDRRFAGRPRQTYAGNLRLALQDMKHTVMVEWLDKAPPALADSTKKKSAAGATTSSSVPGEVVAAPNDPDYSRVVWLIGLDKKRPFTVDAANNPPRVNVLVMN